MKMQTAWRAFTVIVLAMIAGEVNCTPSVFDAPAPWLAVADNILAREPFVPVVAKADDVPLRYDEKTWHVTLLVGASRSIEESAYCQGTLLGDVWVLTAASCICRRESLELPWVTVLLTNPSSTRYATRTTALAAWIYHDRAGGPPHACYRKPVLSEEDDARAEYAVPTEPDLALLKLDSKNAPAVSFIGVLGSDPDPAKSLLESLRPETNDNGNFRPVLFESVVRAQSANRGHPVIVRHAVPHKAGWVFGAPRLCNDSGPGAMAGWQWCADFTRVRPERLDDALRGTGIVLSDHRHPLLAAMWAAPDVAGVLPKLIYLNRKREKTDDNAADETIASTLKMAMAAQPTPAWVPLEHVKVAYTLNETGGQPGRRQPPPAVAFAAPVPVSDHVTDAAALMEHCFGPRADSGLSVRRLTDGSLHTVAAILQRASAAGVTDRRQVAYILGTAFRETQGSLVPVREGLCSNDACVVAAVEKLVKEGRVKTNYALPDEKGRSYYGRGLVQLTGPSRYLRVGDRLGLGNKLWAEPDKAMQMDMAVSILVLGMQGGWFVPGEKLSRYFDGPKEDWDEARAIVNPGSRRASETSAIAKSFLKCMGDR